MAAAQLPATLSAPGTGVRFVPVESDHMQPTVRRGDAVAVVPVNGYHSEGLYVLDCLGQPVVHRCASNGSGGIEVSSDDTRYGRALYTPEDFAAAVLGKVVATCKVIDPVLLGRA